jgi:glucosamine--fructose-6-phosphate aminotransferase (isomerizing)
MCGIIGVITNEKKDMAPILIGALSRLEYRGYDSAGIALPSPNNLHVFKCVGAPSEHLSLNDCKEKSQPIITSLGIGHNRWATHGKPTLANAHPHIDSENRIAVVHNGTILNYEILRKELQDKGVVFASETDTEVIPQLIADYLKSGISMEEAFFSTVAKLTGAYGIVAFDKQDETRLYVAKEGSPIVIGMTDDAYYVASSIHGFLPFTDKFITLEDGEVAILTLKPKLAITIVNSKARKNVLTHTTQVAEQVHAADLLKGDFETFMLKEIHEQPATTLATMLGRVDETAGVAVLGGLFDSQAILEKAKNILITGCGTAYHAGEVGAYVIEHITEAIVRTEIASEGRYKKLNIKNEDAIVFSISQSGETADTIEYLKELKRKAYNTFGVVNVVGSAVAELTGKGIYTKAGAEIGVASTKAFTSQLVAMYLIALYIGRMQKMGGKDGMSFAKALLAIPNQMKQTLLLEQDVKAIVEKYHTFSKIQFLGRGIHVPVAKEASLKFKEITYIETGAYPLGELKHGPIAIVDDATLSVILLPCDELFEQGVNSIEQIKSKGGKVLLITDESARNHPVCSKVDDILFLPHLEDSLFYPFLEIIPLQLFAYYFAKKLGRNIDKPRNLAKSVTVQ